MNLNEGGNIFKTAEGQPTTVRINRDDVRPTISWLEQVTGLKLLGMELGTTGKKTTSGDLDIAVNEKETSKTELVKVLIAFLNKAYPGENAQDWVKKSGINVHFRTPIRGTGNKGFVQTDFMFLPDVTYSKYYLHSAQDSNYKGVHRNVLLSSIAKPLGYKINQTKGLMDRATNELVTNDWNQIAKLLLNSNARQEDLHSVETIMNALEGDPKRDIKIKDARETLPRVYGVSLDEGVSESYFLAKLRDRIATPGIYGLYESEILNEGARIEHIEDLVFTGRNGVTQALQILNNLEHIKQNVTIKWDGKPAIIFGRNEAGKFVLTDKSGFTAKGYDGLATSPAMMADIQNARGSGREDLIAMYEKLFPLLEQTIPLNMKGYVQGDLMYASTPVKHKGKYSFTPNQVTYEVDADSDIGKAIGNSEVGVAIHTFYQDPSDNPKPIKDFAHRLKRARGVLILDPYFDETPTITIDPELQADMALLKSIRGSVGDFMDPSNYRPLKLSDLPTILKRYINYRVRLENFDNLGEGFIEWLQQSKVSQPKIQRIGEYVSNNQEGFKNLVTAFRVLNDVKVHIADQLENQTGPVTAHIAGIPGGEGFVTDTQHGPVKFVDRFRFSAKNFAK